MYILAFKIALTCGTLFGFYFLLFPHLILSIGEQAGCNKDLELRNYSLI